MYQAVIMAKISHNGGPFGYESVWCVPCASKEQAEKLLAENLVNGQVSTPIHKNIPAIGIIRQI